MIATLLLLVPVLAAASSLSGDDETVYACPPCGCPGDAEPQGAPGTCGHCGMTLAARSASLKHVTPVERSTGPKERVDVAVLVFPGVQIIDFAAPYEVLGQAGFHVFTVAATREPLTTAMGLQVVPGHTLEDCPKPDVVLVPGGGIDSATADARVLAWLERQAEEARHVLTVCNGAMLLAETGALDGLTATTFYGLIESFRTQHPEVHVVADRRYTDNGRILTTAGLSSGIDGALHLVERLRGRAAAQRVALNMEYAWADDVAYARADFADRMLLGASVIDGAHYPVLNAPGTRWRLLHTGGNASSWRLVWRVEGDVPAGELLGLLDDKLRGDCGWEPRESEAGAGGAAWSFSDAGDRPWEAGARVVPAEEGEGLEVTLTVTRDRAPAGSR